MKQRVKIRFDCDGVVFDLGIVPVRGALQCLRKLKSEDKDVEIVSKRGNSLTLFGRIELDILRAPVPFVGVGNNGAKEEKIREEGGCCIVVDDKIEHLLKLIPLQEKGFIERLILFSRNGTQLDLPEGIERASSWPELHQICQLAEN